MSVTMRRRRSSLAALAFAFLLTACLAVSSAQARPADFRTTYQPAPQAYSSDAGPGTGAVASEPAPASGGSSSDDGTPWLVIGLAGGIPLLLIGTGAVVSGNRKRVRQHSIGVAA